MQFERLEKRAKTPRDQIPFEHMLIVADMDFLVTMVRRFLRTAEKARQIPSGNQENLKTAIAIFNSHWNNLTDIRDALEHFDGNKPFPVPAITYSTSDDKNISIEFMCPNGNLNAYKLFKDARSILEAILDVIGPLERLPSAERQD
jgi:hypothetical protein